MSVYGDNEVVGRAYRAKPTVPALARALDILELFLSEDTPRTIPEITQALQLPRSTAHELVMTLAERHFLDASESSPRRYRPGVRLVQLGQVYLSSVDLARLSQQASAEVAALSDETVQVAILEGSDVIYIAKADSSHAVRLVSYVGSRLPAHCTAGGKILLAALTPERLHREVTKERLSRRLTHASITSFRELTEQLGKARKEGIAYEYCESNTDVACLAAPVYDRAGVVTAAMSMSIPTTRWEEGRIEERKRQITDGAAKLSTLLGYRSAT